MTRICNNCGKELSEESIYCNICGAKASDTQETSPESENFNLSPKTQSISENLPFFKRIKGWQLAVLIVLGLAVLGGIGFGVFSYVKSNEVFTVTFDANGGTNSPQTQEITRGEKAVEPKQVPQREGYDFICWSTTPKSNAPFQFKSQTIDADITLYAFWKQQVTETADNTKEDDEEEKKEEETKKTDNNMVTVPNVVGLEGKPAGKTIEGVGLKFNMVTTNTADGTGYSTVSSQSPAAGSKVKKGSTVTLYTVFHSTASDNSTDYSDDYIDYSDEYYDEYYDEEYGYSAPW